MEKAGDENGPHHATLRRGSHREDRNLRVLESIKIKGNWETERLRGV